MLQKTSHFMREANLIDGAWVQADSGRDDRREQSGQRAEDRHRAEIRQGRDPAGDRGGGGRLRRLEEDLGARAPKLLRKLHDAIMDNQQSAGRAAHHRAGQVAGRG